MPNDQQNSVQTYFEQVLDKALKRYEERVGSAFPCPVNIDVFDDQDFWAFAYVAAPGLNIDCATGVLWRVADVWDRALLLSETLPSSQQIKLLGHRDHAVETSIHWLIQHELNHLSIGHFDLINGAGIAEGRSPQGFGVASRSGAATKPMDFLDPSEQSQAHLCLELQTDHDATEIVLGAYSVENVSLYRYYATCVLVIILIIEAQERQSHRVDRSHPHAATRLFMLIAHLVEMPTIPAIKRAHAEGLNELPASYLPSANELVAYRRDVVRPVMSASQVLAEAIGIPDAWAAVGTAETFFEDIDAVLLRQARYPEDFQTYAAKQWAFLKSTNDKILKKLGWKTDQTDM